MQIEWLITVTMVAKYGSFSEAAEAIPCAQSTVSRHIKNFENELGTTVFVRSSNSRVVKLTPNGEKILQKAEKLISDYYDMLEDAGTLKAHNKQIPLVLGIEQSTFSSSSKGQLQSLLYMFDTKIILTIEELAILSYTEMLITGKVDVVLMPQTSMPNMKKKAHTDDGLLRYTYLGEQQLCIAFGEKYAPKKRDGITFGELKNERFLFHTDIRNLTDVPDDNRHLLFVRTCLDNGFEPEIVTVDRQLPDVKQLLALKGKGIYPSSIPRFLREYLGIVFIPVADAPYCVDYYLVSLTTNKSIGVKRITEFMRGLFDESYS